MKTQIIGMILALCLASPSFAEDSKSPDAQNTFIAVGTAKTKKTGLAFLDIQTTGSTQAYSEIIRTTITNDLLFMDAFKFADKAAFVGDPNKMSNWTTIGVEYLIQAKLSIENNALVLEARLTETTGGKDLINKRYVSLINESKTLAHTFANQIVETLTSLPGIFLTKITMVCDRTGKKEVYIMNYDGSDIRELTKHRSVTVGPNWSPDGTKIAYTVYAKHRDNTKNPDLYELDFRSNSIRLLSNRKGMNSGAAYSPDGGKIALTMHFLGNAEIFSMDANAPQSVVRLSKSFGNSVNPSWSPDGKKITFISDRAGAPMVYVMAADGGNVQRLTFAGKYNDSPSWSPQNNKIAFSGWIDKGFDVFIMNPDGTNIERLSKDTGSNEGPAFSPDGNFITFNSNRTGQDNIYVVNVDGTFTRRLTYGLGNCTSPKWSMPPGKK